MPCAAILELDTEAAARVERVSRRLERELDIATERQRGAPVHLSLAVYPELAIEPAESCMRRFVDGIAKMPLRLAGIGVFPGATNVLYLTPVIRPPLLAAQRRWHRLAARHRSGCAPHYLPEAWVPHVTLAMQLSAAKAAAAVRLLAPRWRPIEATLASAALICFPPVEVAWRRQLEG